VHKSLKVKQYLVKAERCSRRSCRRSSARRGGDGPRAAGVGRAAASACAARRQQRRCNEQALVSLKLKKSVDAEGGRALAVIIEGGYMAK